MSGKGTRPNHRYLTDSDDQDDEGDEHPPKKPRGNASLSFSKLCYSGAPKNEVKKPKVKKAQIKEAQAKKAEVNQYPGTLIGQAGACEYAFCGGEPQGKPMRSCNMSSFGSQPVGARLCENCFLNFVDDPDTVLTPIGYWPS